jgi:hypothetical protein
MPVFSVDGDGYRLEICGRDTVELLDKRRCQDGHVEVGHRELLTRAGAADRQPQGTKITYGLPSQETSARRAPDPVW